MSFKFNLFPREPQKSYYPEGERDSTANSLFQLREINRQTVNQYQLIKDSGKQYWAGPAVATPGGWTIEQNQKKKISNPRLYKKIGSSKTYNDGVGSRLQRLKTTAIAHSNNNIGTIRTGHYEFGITGGNKQQVGNYTVHTFTAAATNFVIPSTVPPGTYEYYLVAGGGGGAGVFASAGSGGGGGGSGVLIGSQSNVASTTYTVVVGEGGNGGNPGAGGTPAPDGNDSSIPFPTPVNTNSVKGEGGISNTIGGSGGAGGNSGTGNQGGITPVGNFSSGGGGGADTVGNDATGAGGTSGAGKGGNGISIPADWRGILPALMIGGGGGGGSGNAFAGAVGGTGGGGNGGASNTVGLPGTANTGGGGGGASGFSALTIGEKAAQV